jgi:hypothetical protein
LFTGARALAEYNRIFGTSAAGVPVENSGGAGTRDGHWRESLLDAEIMTGYVESSGSMPLSTITVGALADLGYQVNMNAADAFTRPATAAPAAPQVDPWQAALDAIFGQFDGLWQREDPVRRHPRLAR